MFDNLKALGTISALMKNKDKLAEAAQRVRSELERTRVTGESGGGLVRAVASGEMKLISLEMSPALTAGIASSEGDRAMASSLVTEAVNDALTRARERAQEIIRREAQALGLPELPGDIAGLLR